MENYRHIAVTGRQYLKAIFLRATPKGRFFKLDTKVAYFFQESVICPLIQFTDVKAENSIDNLLCSYFKLVEYTGMFSLASV